MYADNPQKQAFQCTHKRKIHNPAQKLQIWVNTYRTLGRKLANKISRNVQGKHLRIPYLKTVDYLRVQVDTPIL